MDPGAHISVASKKGKKGVNSLPRGIELGSAGVEQGSVTSWAALRMMTERVLGGLRTGSAGVN